jgi:hypothetical protein
LAQEAQTTTQKDIQLIDRLISDTNFDVYLLRNGGVHPKGRYCEKLHTTSKGLGNYQTNRSTVLLGINELDVSTAYKTKETYIAGGASGCNKPAFEARSKSPETISKDNVPFITSYKLTHDFCYLRYTYTDCSTRCAASANGGSEIYSIVLSKKIAESIAKTSCEN